MTTLKSLAQSPLGEENGTCMRARSVLNPGSPIYLEQLPWELL